MSMMRYCEIYKAKDKKWYLALAPQEYGTEDDAIHYGPFRTLDEAEEELKTHSNPGGMTVDDKGKRKTPKNPQKNERHNMFR